MEHFRGTGKTTSMVLDFISECIRDPFVWKEYRDHASAPKADRFGAEMVIGFITDLRLTFEYSCVGSKFRFRSTHLCYIIDDCSGEYRRATEEDIKPTIKSRKKKVKS